MDVSAEDIRNPEKFDEILEELNKNTCIARIGGWTRNLVMNENIIRNSLGLNSLFGLFEGMDVPVILVGAGPSLDNNIDFLKKCRDRAFIVCCDAAHKSLTSKNIDPHLVFAVDSSSKVREYIDYSRSKDVILALHSFIHPSVYEDWEGGMVWFNLHPTKSSPLTQVLTEFTGQIGEVCACGSVSTVMLSFAIGGLRGDPIILVGMDSAYYEEEKHHSSNSPAGDFNLYQKMETFDNYGRKCITNPVLMSFARWIEDSCCRAGGPTYINATEGGIISRGLLVMSLEKVYEKFLTKKFNFNKILSEHKVRDFAIPEKRWEFSDGIPIMQKSTYMPEYFVEALKKLFTEEVK